MTAVFHALGGYRGAFAMGAFYGACAILTLSLLLEPRRRRP